MCTTHTPQMFGASPPPIINCSLLHLLRGLLPISNSSRSPTTALTRIKSRALLSIESVSSPSDYEEDSKKRLTDSHALVPLSAKSTAMTSELEERIRKWKMHARRSGELPAQQIPSSQMGCSCPIGNNTRNNLTSIKLWVSCSTYFQMSPSQTSQVCWIVFQSLLVYTVDAGC